MLKRQMFGRVLLDLPVIALRWPQDACGSAPHARRSSRKPMQGQLPPRKESIRLAWKLRLALLLLVMLIISVTLILATREFWSIRIGQSLVCKERMAQSDLILVDNLAPDYLLF